MYTFNSFFLDEGMLKIVASFFVNLASSEKYLFFLKKNLILFNKKFLVNKINF